MFEHYSIPLENEPSLTVKTKPLDNIAVENMEQALERSKTLKSVQTSRASSSGAQEMEVPSFEDDEDLGDKSEIQELKNQIANISLRQDKLYNESCEWRNQFNENLHSLST